MKFVSLHSHSTFSYMDGYGTPLQHFQRAAELGMSSLAITDHGNCSSHVQAEKAALKTGVKFIPGLEAYFHTKPASSRKFHLTLLAMNQGGYQNLMRIITRSWAEGFFRWPTVSPQMLKDHHEGLIVLSGCSDSMLACSLLGGKTIPAESASWDRAVRVANSFKDLFGDRFYLECQMFPELERAHHINTAYERMSNELDILLVGTADVHTLRAEDGDMRILLHAAGRGNNTAAKQAESWEYDVPSCYPENDRVVLERLMGTKLSRPGASRALAGTVEIASRCNVTLPKAEMLKFPGTKQDLVWSGT